MTVVKNLVSESKYNIKCPYKMEAKKIVVHETANDASARDEISYMISNNNEVSFHYAVDDVEVVQGVPENRNAWHAGDGGKGKGNREGLAIEICYSKSGGERWHKAIENAAQFIADKLKERGWGIDKVTKHQDYSGKHCPHRILDEYGWDNFLNLIMQHLDNEKSVDVFYQVWDSKKRKWLPEVKNLEDYAGVFGDDICCFYAKLSKGNIFYKVHTKGGRWLPEVMNRSDYAGIFGKAVDGLMVRTDTKKRVKYAVHLRKQNRWLPFVSGYDASDSENGYAGIIGQEIDAIKIYLS